MRIGLNKQIKFWAKWSLFKKETAFPEDNGLLVQLMPYGTESIGATFLLQFVSVRT